MNQLLLIATILFSMSAELTHARMDPSRPHLTPHNCWGECPDFATTETEEESAHFVECEYVQGSTCRANTLNCVGGYLLTLNQVPVNQFLFSNQTNALKQCESMKESIKKGLQALN